MTSQITLSHDEFMLFRAYFERQFGIWLEDDKEYLVIARLSPFLRELHLQSFHQLCAMLQNHPPASLTNRLIELMTTNESKWFRDEHPFAILNDIILPRLVSARSRLAPIRILSAGTAKGQEAFSIAITLHEYCQNNPSANIGRFEILGVDIHQTLIQKAPDGFYEPFDIERGLPADVRERYFSKHKNGWVLHQSIRDMVRFAPHNLMEPLKTQGNYDVVFYRNVMIYFSPHLKTKSLGLLMSRLANDGYLFLGAMESLPDGEWGLERKTHSKGMYFQKK